VPVHLQAKDQIFNKMVRLLIVNQIGNMP